MDDTTNQFKRKPRQVAPKGKRIAVSDEAKQAYEALIKARDVRDETYTRHLPSPDNKAGR